MTAPVIGGSYEKPRFDWYQASISASEDDVISELVEAFHADMRPCRGIPQYDRSLSLHRTQHLETLCEISYGGNNGAHPHVKATGETAHPVATAIKTLWPVHSVSRVDSCYDFVGENLYDQIRPILDQCHHELGVFRNEMGFPENGRTFYLGSPKSPVRLRCYEKDKELIAKGQPYVPGHLRLELQVRPRTAEKTRYASLTPEALWGCTRWSRNVLSRVLALKPEPIKQVPKMKKTAENKLAYVFGQYAHTLQEVGEERAIELLRVFYAKGTEGVLEALSDALPT